MIDTPGLLDRQLEDRNTIEMQVRRSDAFNFFFHHLHLPCSEPFHHHHHYNLPTTTTIPISPPPPSQPHHPNLITTTIPTSLPPCLKSPSSPPFHSLHHHTYHHHHHSKLSPTTTTQAITALAHLRAHVIFIMDPSEQCGFNMQAQVSGEEELDGWMGVQ